MPISTPAQTYTPPIRPINLGNGTYICNSQNSLNVSQLHTVVKKSVNKTNSASRLSLPKFFNSIGSKMANLLPPSAAHYQAKQQHQNYRSSISSSSLKPSRAPPPPALFMNQSQHCVPIVVQKYRTPPPPLTPLSTRMVISLFF